MQNYKGNWCPWRPNLFCQEGFCEECEVWLKIERNLCRHCGINIDVAREMFPKGYNTCEEVGL